MKNEKNNKARALSVGQINLFVYHVFSIQNSQLLNIAKGSLFAFFSPRNPQFLSTVYFIILLLKQPH